MPTEFLWISGLQSALGPWGEAVAIFFARWLIFAFVPLAALTSWKKSSRALRHAAYEAAWSALLAFLLAMALGALIQRARPFRVSSDIHLLIPGPGTFSLPSGHASVAFAVAAALAFGNRRLGLAAYVVAILVAMGRVAVGVHYPTDVLAGALVGTLAFWIVRRVHHAIRRKDLMRL